MTKQEIINQVKSLHLPDGSYIVFGGSPLAAYGIRESNDIDLLVTDEVLDELGKKGWKWLEKAPGDRPRVFELFEAHAKWDFSSYQPTLEQLLATATVMDGVPFASLQEVRQWKQSSGRPKDILDIQSIDDYLEK